LKKLTGKEQAAIGACARIDHVQGVIELSVLEESQEYNLIRAYLYAAKAKGWKIQYAAIDKPRQREIWEVIIKYNLHIRRTVKARVTISKMFVQESFSTTYSYDFKHLKSDKRMVRRIHKRKGLSEISKHIEITGMEKVQFFRDECRLIWKSDMMGVYCKIIKTANCDKFHIHVDKIPAPGEGYRCVTASVPSLGRPVFYYE